MLLMTLTMAQFLYVTTTAVQAVYEELESQSVNIENTNVSFNVSYEDGTHSKQLKISEGGVISCNIKIEKNGLHQIVTGEKNIKIPVKFEKKDIVASDYFDKQNTFTFTAEYKVENKTEKSIQKNIIIDTQWTDDVDTNIENEFVKFQSLDETNVMLEQKISVETANQILPKQEENIELEVPELDGIKPSKINVLENGKEIDSKYDADLAKLIIQNKNDVNNDQISWKTDKDVYKIIYLYEEKINVKQISKTVKGTITTKYYGKADAVKKVLEEEKTIKPTTEIISAEETSTKELPKEYFNVKSSKKAYIEETATIEIPEVSQIKDISIEEKMNNAAMLTYEELFEEHKEDYRTLFARVEFQLDGVEKFDVIPTNERIERAAKETPDIGLSKMLFDYGRYLLISCSRPGGLPATLQGIWNQDFTPPWESKYTININTEMNYWLAESCNLSECHMPLFDLLERMVENGRRTAEKMYGCRGFVAHHNTDIHGDTAPQDTWYPATYWVMGAAWLCTHLWTHYEYTLDREFLERSYPIMCEAALFFIDFLVEKDGYLVTCPSLSPENTYCLPNGEMGAVSYGATMDNQILRDLFSQCLAAGKILQATNSAFLEKAEYVLQKLLPTRIGSDGRIMEWMEEYEECEPGHRHISHLYGLHPSEQITVDNTPKLAEAARKTLETRLKNGGGHTGWSRAWIINHYAKLWDGEIAYHNIEQMLASSIYPNLFDRHPPFQIDGNFGVTAAIAEMLVQSTAERIILLPALPVAWTTGSVKGLRIKGNAEISLKWEEHKLTECTIHAYEKLHTRIIYRNKTMKIILEKGEEKNMML